ncbi:hypothetical protein LTR40_014912, partial [Exophiala xenobiotica]
MTPTSAGAHVPPLLWKSIYATDELCDHKLSLHVVKTHQILVIKRGGCSFSRKLSNIPAFSPSSQSLQLVILVSYGTDQISDDSGDQASAGAGAGDDEENLVRPYLDEAQKTPAGLPRHNAIPMVMVAGGKRVYDTLATKTVGVGIKRRYHVETKGVRIANLII